MNGGASDPWAKKPTLRDKPKPATIERRSSKKFCELCLISGIKSPIQLFQLNDEEALLMCKNEDCTYMPSSNWGDLVVRRHISQLSQNSSRKNRPSSSSSASSSLKNAISVHSAPQRLQSSVKSPSKSSTPCLLVKPHSTTTAKSLTHHSEERVISSPTPSIDSTVSDEPERKTLVPIAPFLCRHAHSFAAFETKSIEGNRHQEESLSRRENFTQWNLNKIGARGLKRRGSSLDSDSLSSCSSSLDSRPVSPVEHSVKPVGWQTSSNQTKKVILSATAVSKLREGSWKLKLVKDSEGRTTQVKFVTLEPQTQGTRSLVPITPESKNQTNHQLNSSTELKHQFTSHSQELNLYNQLVTSGASSRPVLESHSAGSKNSSNISVQAHINAINEHLAALCDAANLNGLALPLELSNLIPQTCNNSAALLQSSPESSRETPSIVSTDSEFSTASNCGVLPKDTTESALPFDDTGLHEFFIDNTPAQF
ncbi:hypothetical protein ElyMa_002889500 [Elysia marginata]|uniref:Uncharacterized protein n=1 Tax=Elysia marginata TaxID=1093978 RepID=A0AAV4I3F1_9GAST|nr:hypothetical protein ElyMa_002889500 [Elysia marginata]